MMHEWQVGDRCITSTEHLIAHSDKSTIPTDVLGYVSSALRIVGGATRYTVKLDRPITVSGTQHDTMYVTSKLMRHIPKGLR